MSTIFLARHGESQSNAGKPTDCPECAGLTVRGVDQAKFIAAYLKSHTSLDLIVTSRYKRTQETALFTESLFPDVPLEQWDVHEFTYLSPPYFGVSNIHDRRPLVEAYWEQKLPTYEDGPDSESFDAFIKRVRAFITQLQSRQFEPDETIAIFSHEQFITAVLWLIERNPTTITRQTMDDFKNFLKQNPVPNGAIVSMQFHQRHHSWRIKRVTDHLHLSVSVQRKWAWVQVQKVALPAGC
jgi:broad specificity phosphatase PhoE